MNHPKKLVLVLFVCFSSAFLFHENGFCGNEPREIVVVFRFDDISSKSDTDLEKNIIEQFKKRNLPVTLSVIPFVLADDARLPDSSHPNRVALPFMVKHDGKRSRNVSPGKVIPLTTQKAEIIRKGIREGIVEAALHGYTHKRNGVSENHTNSEFRGIDYDMQVRMLDEGRSLLENVLGEKIRIFVPPWNSYDLSTVRALEKLRFDCLSADMTGEVFESSTVRFVPVTCGIAQLRDAIDMARNIQDPRPVIMVLFHSYDFIEENKMAGFMKMNDFIALIDYVSAQKDLRVLSMKGAMETIQDFGPRRYRDNSDIHSLLFFTPSILRFFPDKVYLTSELANQYRPWNVSILILFYMGILGVSIWFSYFIGMTIFRKTRSHSRIWKYSGAMVLVIVSGYAYRDFSIGYHGAIAIVISLGIFAGIFSSFRKITKEAA